jgi:hypothetical protein
MEVGDNEDDREEHEDLDISIEDISLDNISLDGDVNGIYICKYMYIFI